MGKSSGVNPKIFLGTIEAPKAPMGVGVCPLPRSFFLILDLKMAICRAFLVQFFCSSAKTLTGRKDTLAQVYFYWGGGQSPPLTPESTPLFQDTVNFNKLTIHNIHYTSLTALFPGLPRSAGTRKVKPIWIY